MRPFGFVRFSGTTKVPQRASTPCTMHGSGGHDHCAFPKERSIDADDYTDADADGGHQADQRPNNPPTPPMNPMRRRVRTCRHGRTSTDTIPQFA